MHFLSKAETTLTQLVLGLASIDVDSHPQYLHQILVRGRFCHDLLDFFALRKLN